MKLKKTILVFIMILSFEGVTFGQQMQMVPAGPSPQSSVLGSSSQTTWAGPSLQVPGTVTSPAGLPESRVAPGLGLPQQQEALQPVTMGPGAHGPLPRLTQPEKSSDFELFIAGKVPESISTSIRQFGYDLFRQPPSTFAPTDKVPVGPDYVIGPGDEVRVNVWGNVEGQFNIIVDRDGKITLPKIGTIGVTGLTFEQLKETLQKEFSKYFTGFQMSVSMGGLRSIKVYVVGNAERPGAYTVSSFSTLVNALFEAGGPGKTGTMRNIQVKRSGKKVVEFDMYDFLLQGDKSKDIRLLPEDVIFIPPVGPLVGIAGNVKNPAIFELKGETRLLDLVRMAGGLAGTAYRGRVQIQRIQNSEYRSYFEGDLIDVESNVGKNIVLKESDLVRVFAVTEKKNTLTITGAVASPGEYGVESGVTRVKDLISLTGGLLYYASNQMEVTRVTVTQSGPRTERLVIDASKALKDDPAHNIPLQMNDYLFVRTVPEWRLYRTVTLTGEVMYPGTYTITRGERLSSLIERAGGYTDMAYLRGAVFTRERVRELQKKNIDEMTKRMQRELLAEGATQTAGALSAEEIQARKLELEQRQKFVEVLKQQQPTGRMSIKLAHIRLLKGSEYDIELEEADTLTIPTRNAVVNVVGAVMSDGSYIYNEHWGYEDYIQMAGGYSRYADEDNVFVMKADGSARKLAQGFVNWNPFKKRWETAGFDDNRRPIEEGDAIVVPEKMERTAWMRNLKDITQILANVGLTATSIALLYETLKD
ncbi:MAG: Polysialic acid transport protein KpsD precursor [Syntrophorhabdus sp. PtaU1.Bin153]|nr:MAG: Polysialic acid transport protein KpsD precursor [Syntrophorhabdus sp. PtaU1.Bin153]